MTVPNSLLEFIAVFILSAGVAWLIARRIYAAGRAAGYLDGRNFLIKRRLLLRTTVYLDGQPLDRAACIWIETNDFARDETARIAALRDWEHHSGRLIDVTTSAPPDRAD
ncbi:MAG TPA: hypothetical protein VGI40_01705 [Pirellulaceae bacterium]